MLAETLKSILEFLKLKPSYLFSIFLCSTALLFIPEVWLQKIGVHNLVDKYQSWIGALFIASIGFLLAYLFGSVHTWIKTKIWKKKAEKKLIKKLHSLNENEKQILRYYFAKGTISNRLRFDDGVVQELVRKNIIYRASNIGNITEGVDHNISEKARDYLSLHIDLLMGDTSTYRTDLGRRF